MLDVLIAVILGIVEGITEWLPISSTGHMILVEQFLHMSTSHEFNSMFRVVIQLGAIMAVVVLYFNKLNPFSKRKSAKQKRNTINLWCKIVVACLPAAVIGLLFDDILDKYLYNYVVVALMLIIYGIFFILIEKKNEHTRPQITKLTELTYQMALIIGGFQVLTQRLPDHFDMILSQDSPHYMDLPGISVLVGGMWIANLSYWGFNQYIIQFFSSGFLN